MMRSTALFLLSSLPLLVPLGACGGAADPEPVREPALAAPPAPAPAQSEGAKLSSVMEKYDPAAPQESLKALAAGPSASVLKFEHEKLDLGEVLQHTDYDLEFPFVVEGPDPVVVTGLETSCGCTDARIETEAGAYTLEDPLAPGTKGKVLAKFKSAQISGFKSTHVTVRGNAQDMPRQLDITVKVRPLFEMAPREVMFGDVLVGSLRAGQEDPAREVMVVAAAPFEIESWLTTPPGVRIEELADRAVTAPDGRSQQRYYRVTLLKDLPKGRFYQTAIAKTTLGRNLEFVIMANVFGAVSYAPEQRVTFGMVDAGQELSRRVNLTATMKDVSVPKPTLELIGGEAFTCEIEEKEAGRSYVVKVHLKKEAALGQHNARLKIWYPEEAGVEPHELLVTAIVRNRG